ncbi:hypothetical protein ABTK78_20110, partial [Acinetobacter baumannii]
MNDLTTAEAAIEAATTRVAATVKKAKAAKASDAAAAKTAPRAPYPVEVDQSRDARLTDFGKETLNDRYLLPGETYQDLFVRVA